MSTEIHSFILSMSTWESLGSVHQRDVALNAFGIEELLHQEKRQGGRQREKDKQKEREKRGGRKRRRKGNPKRPVASAPSRFKGPELFKITWSQKEPQWKRARGEKNNAPFSSGKCSCTRNWKKARRKCLLYASQSQRKGLQTQQGKKSLGWHKYDSSAPHPHIDPEFQWSF